MQLLRRFIQIFVCLVLAACSKTPQDQVISPLSKAEFDAVVAEITRMVQSDVSQVDQFKVIEATPERIARLLRMPEYKGLESNLRANALIFASRADNILTFEKPSDVESKVSQWLGSTPGYKGHLWGPFKSSSLQANAFVAFHICTLPDEWIKLRGTTTKDFKSDFGRIQNTKVSLASLSSNSLENRDWLDFKACLYKHIRFTYSHKEADKAMARKSDVKLIETDLIPTLQSIFF
jgi:hypothetical protein